MSKTFAVTNFKGVREIELSPTGSLVVIAGGNGAGKSSFIDAFVELFDPKGVRLTPEPIRKGSDEARAEYTDTDLDVRIVRTWKKNDAGKLEVFALDGARYGKPADMVAQLTGGLIFDPVAFLNLDEKRQRDALLAKVDLPFDIDELAREKSGAEQRRLEAGRDVRRIEGALATRQRPGKDTPTEEVSAAAIIAELSDATRHNAEIENAKDDLPDLVSRVTHLRRELQEAEFALMEAEAAAREPEVDVTEIRARLDAVESTNAAVRSAAQYRDLQEDLEEARAAQKAAQDELDDVESRKAAGLAQAEFPIGGLSVDEDGILFDGIPFTQVNTAARLQVAFAIATAGDPDLKLVIVRSGDMLDGASLATVAGIAEQRGYTVLMERDRDESRQIGFTIVDGELADGGAA